MTHAHRGAAWALATAALAAVLAAPPVLGQEGGVRQRRTLERPQDLSRQEQQIRRTRIVTRRILRDRRASEEIRKEATELDTVLDERQDLIDRLQARHNEFVAQHQADIGEMEDLLRRAREIDDRLAAARKDAIDSSKDDVAALKNASARAADLADGLRARYLQERRGGRGHPAGGSEGQP